MGREGRVEGGKGREKEREWIFVSSYYLAGVSIIKPRL